MERTMTTMMNQTNDLRPLLDHELDAIAGGNKTSGNLNKVHSHNIADKGTLVISTYTTVDGKYTMPFAGWYPK
jgi:hypothetical protein